MVFTEAQKYLSTRGGEEGLTFEEVVLKGLASDGGLFVPESIPTLPSDWETAWSNLSFEELAFEILSLYISRDEIPAEDLQTIIKKSYGTFRHPERTPLVQLDGDKGLWLMELFHGPTFAFKDVALQFLGNLFEYFLVRKNEGKTGKERHHLTVIGATSGDTGSAAIYGLRGKKDVSIFILYPDGRVSPIQELQMTTVPDANVHCLAVEGSFDDCQDSVKALFADPDMNSTHNVAAVNSINWARILAQMTYYFYAYFSLIKSPGYDQSTQVRFVVPSGNFGDILAGWFAKRMGLPASKLVIATNENDILARFFSTNGAYTKHAVHGSAAAGGIPADGAKAHADGVKETLAPAMDILVSSNFERLLYFFAFEAESANTKDVITARKAAGSTIKNWLNELKSAGGFTVTPAVAQLATAEFEADRVSDPETVEAIKQSYTSYKPTSPNSKTTSSKTGGYILDPHSAIGVAASLRSIARTSADKTAHIALATAHAAKFANAVEMALKNEDGFDFEADVLPVEFEGMEKKEKRVLKVGAGEGWMGIREIVKREVESEVV